MDSEMEPIRFAANEAGSDQFNDDGRVGDARGPSKSRPSNTSYEVLKNDEQSLQPQLQTRTTGTSFVPSIASFFSSNTNKAAHHHPHQHHHHVPHIHDPWQHERPKQLIDDKPPSDTVRHFNSRHQRGRLFVKVFMRFFITAFLCGCLAGLIYGFSTIDHGLTSTQKKVYNALFTGFSISLGLNLATSVKRYAQIMRWRLLAATYRTLETFELIMQSESQVNVFKLIWAARTRGQWWPNSIQALAVLWVSINAGLQILTALIGLTFEFDVSDDRFHMVTNGNISVPVLSQISLNGGLGVQTDLSFAEQSVYAQNYGAQAISYNVWGEDFDPEALVTQGQVYEQQYYSNYDETLYWYQFVDHEASDWNAYLATNRTITSKATCQEYTVLSGGYAGFDNNTSGNIEYSLGGDETSTINVPVALSPTDQTTWMVQNNTDGGADCGPRCAVLWALQSSAAYGGVTDDIVPRPRLFQCNNTVSHVINREAYGHADIYELPDAQARMFAGAIAWTGVNDKSVDYLQYQFYTSAAWLSPNGSVSAEAMASVPMGFTAGAIAAYDVAGPRTYVSPALTPTKAQYIKVEWNWAITILGVIPLVQFLLMWSIVIWANKVAIKDESCLSIARLLRPIVDKLGDHGCLLTGEEITETLGNYKVMYGARIPEGTTPGEEASVLKHLDIIEQSEGLGKWHAHMPQGCYDGVVEEKKKVVVEKEKME